MSRTTRQDALHALLASNPFLTDEELAQRFGVSVQTVRLDRAMLGIPELRARTREVAQRALGRVRSIGHREVVGELLDLELGRQGLSILETEADMAFERSRIIRGQYLYAQAESLALALIDADEAVAQLVNVKFKRPVHVGERLVAKAEALRQPHEGEVVVLVVTRVQSEVVFRGKFLVQSCGLEVTT